MIKVSKSAQLINAVDKEDWKTAFKIAKDFRIGITKDESKAISQAYECIVHPQFYQSLKVDLDSRINIGKQLVIDYVKSLENKKEK